MVAIYDNKADVKDLVAHEIRHILENLGGGRVDGVAYDTAWLARLIPHYPDQGFEVALEWLRRHQYEDGSWGAPTRHYHDRYISTLAAIVALKELNCGPDDLRRVERGQQALWRYVARLPQDDYDTIGFPILSASLSQEAAELGLDVPQPPLRFAGAFRKKVDALLHSDNKVWLGTTLTFSLEAFRYALTREHVVFEQNWSINSSPASTAGYLMQYRNDAALQYLKEFIRPYDPYGISPAVAPMDIASISWGINHLHMARAISPEDPAVRKLLDHVWSLWSPERGIGATTYFNAVSSDDSAAAFTALKWAGYPVTSDVFSFYELDDHFRCFEQEVDMSISAQIRVLLALRYCTDHPSYERWLHKAVNALIRSDKNGAAWVDKWHISPYYVNGVAALGLIGVNNDLAMSRIRWILHTQNDDGGWGFCGSSTAEETAYCLQSLLLWNDQIGGVDETILSNAARYLVRHLRSAHRPQLWIAKSLYTPHYIVQAAIVSALYQYLNR